jgi:ABC-type enterochelin transport system permease subunit
LFQNGVSLREEQQVTVTVGDTYVLHMYVLMFRIIIIPYELRIQINFKKWGPEPLFVTINRTKKC